jgi:hypothetical protein
MMNRLASIVAGVTLGVATLGGGVSAQETPAVETVADGGYSVSDPTNPIVAAEGETRTYGEIATGNNGGVFVGDPAGLASIQSHEDLVGSVPAPDLTPDDDGGLDLSSGMAPAPTDGTTTTTPETATTDGATTTEGTAPAEAAPVESTTTTTAAPSACAGYATWYDAQVAYESAGGVNGDPGLVGSVDPDYDGVACEELIVY